MPTNPSLALAALRRLATFAENRARLVRAGALPPLASAGLSGEVEIQREVAACLCNISLDEEVRVDTAQVCMGAVVHLAQSGDLEAARQAVGALANLAEDIETHK